MTEKSRNLNEDEKIEFLCKIAMRIEMHKNMENLSLQFWELAGNYLGTKIWIFMIIKFWVIKIIKTRGLDTKKINIFLQFESFFHTSKKLITSKIFMRRINIQVLNFKWNFHFSRVNTLEITFLMTFMLISLFLNFHLNLLRRHHDDKAPLELRVVHY